MYICVYAYKHFYLTSCPNGFPEVKGRKEGRGRKDGKEGRK
jgi:hypothetical protein